MSENPNIGSKFESTPRPPVRLRVAVAEDISFIFNSWLKSYRNSNQAHLVCNSIYFSEQHKLIERLVKDSKVIVACNNEDPTQLYGYICAGNIEGIFCLHYLYVKHSFRGLGIATALINAFEHDVSSAGIFTHMTKPMERLAIRFNLVYHPYILTNYVNKKEE